MTIHELSNFNSRFDGSFLNTRPYMLQYDKTAKEESPGTSQVVIKISVGYVNQHRADMGHKLKITGRFNSLVYFRTE